jgi:hypothetical protein
VVVDYDGVIFVRRLLKIPDFNGLVHTAGDELGIMKEDGVNIVIMGLEFVNASSSLKTKDVNIIILSCKGK